MRRRLIAIMLLGVIIVNTNIVNADEGEAGFFGGISEGINLPRNIDSYVGSSSSNKVELQYKEVVFITGEPIELEGIIEITKDDKKVTTDLTGVYKEKYAIEAFNEEKNLELERNFEIETSFRRNINDFSNEIIRNSVISKWDEVITIDGKEYELDEKRSTFSKASSEDVTPGINYYDTDVTYRAIYNTSQNETIVVDVYNSIYGFKQPWAKVESQNITMNVEYEGSDKSWQIEVDIKPKMDANKTIYFDQNSPFPISFAGTYIQRMERNSTLAYEIKTNNLNLSSKDKKGTITIKTANQLEKLSIPKGLEFLYGHWSEEDIKQLYSMEILTESPHANLQNENMTRGQYVQALCKAMNLDTSKYTKKTSKLPQIFKDVPTNHPLYPYIMAAYDARLTIGRGNDFGLDDAITREEAFVIYIRVIGLERLGITNNPTTPFIDDKSISSWAKKEIMAGVKLGIIKGNSDGTLMPKQNLKKVEAGAIINRLIKYLRTELTREFIN